MSRYFLNNTYYFITCATINHQKFFYSFNKDIILYNLLRAKEKFKIKKLDYGINSDHYHLLGYFIRGNIIPIFLKNINGPAAIQINKLDKMRDRKIWDEYYIYYVDKEELLYKIKGYVIGNPYKHGEVESLDKLKNYKYSTYNKFYKQHGEEIAENLVLSVIKMNDNDFQKELKKLQKK